MSDRVALVTGTSSGIRLWTAAGIAADLRRTAGAFAGPSLADLDGSRVLGQTPTWLG